MTNLQLNLNGFYTRLQNLQVLSNLYQPTVISDQETNFKIHEHGRFKCYLKNRTNTIHARGGVAAYIKNCLPTECHYAYIEAVAIIIKAPLQLRISNI